ncbi:MAG: 5-formyltetrahydrofolate cyclo-ligase [Lautropia sp.]|nr:5-formyltetrahydrofolate cyclo-ligase [Lautropia sp.]
MDESCESRIPRAQLRKLMLARRAELKGETRTRHDRAIARNLQEVLPVRQARVLALYWPIKGEPDLRPLAAGWRAQGKILALPVMVSRDAGLTFCVWAEDVHLEMGPFGIPIPPDRTPVAPDCLVIPCLGFNVVDGKPWRLGYGAGYYDRTLAQRPVPAVGIAYEEGLTDQFEPNAMDAPLSVLVTPSRVIASIASP